MDVCYKKGKHFLRKKNIGDTNVRIGSLPKRVDHIKTSENILFSEVFPFL
jgi:hypothetical protein